MAHRIAIRPAGQTYRAVLKLPTARPADPRGMLPLAADLLVCGHLLLKGTGHVAENPSASLRSSGISPRAVRAETRAF